MSGALTTILLVLSVLIIIAIFMQPTKNQSSNVFDASAGDLFERTFKSARVWSRDAASNSYYDLLLVIDRDDLNGTF